MVTDSLLIYDGDCGFCNASLIWAYKNLPIMPAASPYQELDLSIYGLTLHEAESAVYLVSETYKHRGHIAIGWLFLGQTKTLYKIAGRILTSKILSPIFSLGYTWVAKNRRFLPGATEACGKRPAKG